MSDRLVEKELREIEQFISDFDTRSVVFREAREIEVICDEVDAVTERMRERFDTEEAASVAVIGEGNVTELYNVPDEFEDFSVIVFEVRETRSERGFTPVVDSDVEGLRSLNSDEMRDIDQHLRESDLDVDGLTKEMYEDLQKLQVPDVGDNDS